MDNSQSQRHKTPVYDTLEAESHNYNLLQGPKASASLAAKEAMQQLYKNQLDSLLLQKQKQKQIQRQRTLSDRREFNERAEQGKQAQRMKDMSYKNYYNMLMTNQNQNGESYVSPFSKRDAMKEALIKNNIEDQRQRYQLYEVQARKRQVQRKNAYKNQLMDQIQERRKKEYLSKNNQQRQKEQFQMHSKVPEEIRRYQKEKKKEEVEKYKQDLDRLRQGREYRSQSQTDSGPVRGNPQFHNILTNPLPYNIQNPYILKQMGVVPKNQSYLAMKGSQHLKLS